MTFGHSSHETPAAKAEPKAKAKAAPEPIKFSLIQYKDNDALAVESGDYSKLKEDDGRACSCLGVYNSFDEAHAELVTKGQERADKEKKETEAAKKKADK